MNRLEDSLMRIDVHVHSYPTLVEGGTFRPYQGIKWTELEEALKRKEDETGVKHGVFYGPHNSELLTRPPESVYLSERVLPMLENHDIQLVGVSSWDNLQLLYDLEKAQSQIEATRLIAQNKGLSILDLPKPAHHRRKTNRVYVAHQGEATIAELWALPDDVRERTFLCYNGMAPGILRNRVFGVRRETDLKILGGNDAISSTGSLFRTYSEAYVNEVSELLEDPLLFGGLHQGSVPFFDEKVRRWFVCGVIEIMGYRRRGKRVRKLLDNWKIQSKKQ